LWHSSQKVLRDLRKAGAEWKFLMWGRIWFQILGPQTEKTRFPNWVRVLMTRAALVAEERRWRRPDYVQCNELSLPLFVTELYGGQDNRADFIGDLKQISYIIQQYHSPNWHEWHNTAAALAVDVQRIASGTEMSRDRQVLVINCPGVAWFANLVIAPTLHYNDSLWISCIACCTACCTTNPRQIETSGVWANVRSALEDFLALMRYINLRFTYLLTYL